MLPQRALPLHIMVFAFSFSFSFSSNHRFAPVILNFLWNIVFCSLICWRSVLSFHILRPDSIYSSSLVSPFFFSIQSESRGGNIFAGKASHYRFMFYLLVYFICWPLNLLNSVISYFNGGCQVSTFPFYLYFIYLAFISFL